VSLWRDPDMSHIVKSCPLTKLNGGLSRLHSTDEDAVSRVTTLHTKSNSRTFPWLFQYGWRHFIDTEFHGRSYVHASLLISLSSLQLWSWFYILECLLISLKCGNIFATRADAHLQDDHYNFPWLFPVSLTFPWPLSNSLTFPGFPGGWSPCVSWLTSYGSWHAYEKKMGRYKWSIQYITVDLHLLVLIVVLSAIMATVLVLIVCPMLSTAWTEYKFTCVCLSVCVSVALSVNSPTAQTPQRFLVDSLKDVDLHKDVPLGGLDDD